MIRAAVMFVALVAVAGAFAGPASADQTDPRLDALFAQLADVPDAAAAQPIEQEIWRLWGQSADAEVNRLMREGILAMAMNRQDLAIAAFTALVAYAPDFAEGWNKRATVLYLIGDYEGSIADVGQTLALEPRHFGALSGLGLIFDALDDPERALWAYEQALAANPRLPSAQARVEALRRRLQGEAL